jgi:hypothetical protein
MSDNKIRIWFSLFVLAVFCVGLAGGVLIGRRLSPDRSSVGRWAGRESESAAVAVHRRAG